MKGTQVSPISYLFTWRVIGKYGEDDGTNNILKQKQKKPLKQCRGFVCKGSFSKYCNIAILYG